MKILLLEDDPLIAEIIIERLLESKKYIVDYAFDINEATNLLSHTQYDLFIFDINVPNGNGFDFLTKLRTNDDNTPTIFITALNGIDDVKKAFQSGCDDYIKKPFELEELELRINNIKRLYNISNKIVVDKNITLDKGNLTIQINDEIKHLREKEFQILEYIIKQTNAVSNDELSINIWHYDDIPSDATIRTYIKNLRNIIGKEKIETIKGVGYRFIKS